jgi:hypothetical protein
MADARKTDGSNPVAAAKIGKPINPTNARLRGPMPSGPVATKSRARKIATFDPLTAV